MRQRFILLFLSCSLHFHSADKISGKKQVLSQKSRPHFLKDSKPAEKKEGAGKQRIFTGIGNRALFQRQLAGREYLKRQKRRKKIKKRGANRKGGCEKRRLKGSSEKRRKSSGSKKKRGTGKSRTRTGDEGKSGEVKYKVRIGIRKGKRISKKKKQQRRRKPKRNVKQTKSEKIKCKILEPSMKRKRRRRMGWFSSGFQNQMPFSGNYQQTGSRSGNYQRPGLWSRNYQRPVSWLGNYQQLGSWSGNYQRPGIWSGNYRKPGSWSGNYQPSWSGNHHKPWQRPAWQRPTWQRPSLPPQIPVVPTQPIQPVQPTQPQGGGVDSDNNRQVVLLTLLCQFSSISSVVDFGRRL